MDIDDLTAAAEAHADRQARIRALAASSAETRADIAERRERRLASGGLETWQAPLKPAPQPAPAPVQPAPTMTREAQAAWDRWAKAHIANALVKNNRELGKAVGEAMATYVGKRLAESRDEERKARGNLLTRLLQLEAERDGRSLSRIYNPAGAHHADAARSRA